MFLTAYFGLRVFSYFFSPSTPLYHADPINWIVSFFILALSAYFLYLKSPYGWLIIAGELLLGGAGNFLEIKGVSLRTCLLVFSMLIYSFQVIEDRKYKIIYKENKTFIYLLSFIFFIVGISALHGYQLGNNPKLIFADTIPYLFFLYYFPLQELLKLDKFRKAIFNMLMVAVVSNFVFTYFTLAGFSSGIFVLQDSYYHWFRDVANGKITDYGTGFFRIILNEQLVIVPLFLSMLYKQINNENTKKFVFKIAGGTLLAVLTINLTRIYFLALAVGILFLFSTKNWKRWFAYSAAALAFFIIAFTLTHLAATKGKSLGWEYLGLRLQSIAMPQIEDSSLSRLLLLPKIIEKIKAHPLLGNGLGSTVTVYSPIFKVNVITPHFDWGYLEIIAEMGLVGILAWGLLIGNLMVKIKQNRGLFASVVALLVINITSPALFHVLGIIMITYLFANNKVTALPNNHATSPMSGGK
jgi:O-antigen ligase